LYADNQGKTAGIIAGVFFSTSPFVASEAERHRGREVKALVSPMKQ
jgi:hypothetical protein